MGTSLVEVDSTNPVTIAIHEVLNDKVKYQSLKRAKKMRNSKQMSVKVY